MKSLMVLGHVLSMTKSCVGSPQDDEEHDVCTDRKPQIVSYLKINVGNIGGLKLQEEKSSWGEGLKTHCSSDVSLNHKDTQKAVISGCSERRGKDTVDTDYPEGSVPHSSPHVSFSVLFAKSFLLSCQNPGRIQLLPVHPPAGLIVKSSSSEFPVNAISCLCG